MRCPEFEPLINDMNANHIEKEHYCFDYNRFRFDVVFSIMNICYEILVAIHTENWGCVLSMNKNYFVEMNSKDYNDLCRILNLNWRKDHFNSALFLRLLSENSPRQSTRQGVDYTELRRYLPYRHVDEEDKIYFCGWNDHQKDRRQARNFDKTEFFLGKAVAEYCRENNISSLWSDIPRDERQLTNPWD